MAWPLKRVSSAPSFHATTKELQDKQVEAAERTVKLIYSVVSGYRCRGSILLVRECPKWILSLSVFILFLTTHRDVCEDHNGDEQGSV